MQSCRRVFLVASLVLACAQPLRAQQSVDYASVSGRVLDPSGAVVPGAHVTARHLETNVGADTLTDQEGRFRFPYLRVGPYDVKVSAQGFQESSRRLTLNAGAAFELPVTLAVGTMDTNVVVVGEATLLDAARSQMATTVLETEVRSLPMNGRNFLDLALLAPGVAPTNIASTQLFPETSAVPGVSLSVGSQRNLSNNFIVDGLSANDDAAALSGITYGVDAVEQVQVVTSGAHAELGRALGGYVNVVTKSGTNALHGTLYDYVRDDRLNAKNALSGTRLPMDQSQYGGSLGGPIVSDRTFYFTNVEQRRLDQTGLTTIAPANVDAINARLRQVGYGGPTVATGQYANPVDSTNFLVKVDHLVSGRDQLRLRYSLYDVAARNSRGAGGLNAPTASSDLANLDQAIALSNTLTLSARTVLETRAQFAHGDLEAPAADQVGPAVNIAGVAAFGTASGSPTRRVNRMYQVVNNLSHQAGAHALRVGVDFLYNDDVITYPRAVRGSYTFASLTNFLNGIYNNAGFTQTFGVSQVSQTNPNVGFYVQDEWKVGSALTFNLGLRYDLQRLETIATDTNNLSPRFGVAWSPSAARRTIVRAGGGLFYDRVPLRALANALLSAGNTTDVTRLQQIAVSLSPTQSGAPVFPGILDAVIPAVTLPNLTTMDRELENAYSRQASVEVEQQVGERATLERRLPVPARLAAADGGQPERAGLHRVRRQQCLPAESRLRQQQPVFVGREVELPRTARLVHAAAGPMGPLSNLVHVVEVDEQRRRVLLQLADRPVRLVEGLGALGRRPAAPPGDQRRGADLDGAGDDAAAVCSCTGSSSAACCRRTPPRRSTSRPGSRRFRARPAGRSSTASSSAGMPARAAAFSPRARGSAAPFPWPAAPGSRCSPKSSTSPTT